MAKRHLLIEKKIELLKIENNDPAEYEIINVGYSWLTVKNKRENKQYVLNGSNALSSLNYLLKNGLINKGLISGECIFMYINSILHLIPLASKEYQDALEKEEALKQKVSFKDIRIGDILSVIDKEDNYIYLGEFNCIFMYMNNEKNCYFYKDVNEIIYDLTKKVKIYKNTRTGKYETFNNKIKNVLGFEEEYSFSLIINKKKINKDILLENDISSNKNYKKITFVIDKEEENLKEAVQKEYEERRTLDKNFWIYRYTPESWEKLLSILKVLHVI